LRYSCTNETSCSGEIEGAGLKLSEFIRDLLDEKFLGKDLSAELQTLRKKSKMLERDKRILKDEARRLRIKLDPEVLLSEQIQERAEELLRVYENDKELRIAEETAYHRKLIKDYKPLRPRDAEYKIKFKELVAKRVKYGCELKEAKQLTRDQIKQDNILNIPTMPERAYEERRMLQSFMEEAKELVLEENK